MRLSLFKQLQDDKISYVEKIVSQWEMTIGEQIVGIKITLDSNGYYQFKTSHFYQRSELAGSVLSSQANFTSEEEALIYAKKQIVGLYEPEDETAKWVENEYY
jgi:hypothetical protein